MRTARGPTLIKAPRLKPGSHLRVVAPSRSMGIISGGVQETAKSRLVSHGFTISYGDHVYEEDEFNTGTVASRVTDLHDAFRDPSVDGILTCIGGYSSNQLLDALDYDLIRSHPKVLCGFSDITALANAITARTGLITYIGPHFSSWGMQQGFDYSAHLFLAACRNSAPYSLNASSAWSDDAWYNDQEHRQFHLNEGFWLMQPGEASGRMVGGHLRCLNALLGSCYWPGLQDAILFVEEDTEIKPQHFDRQLQSLLHQPDFAGVQALLIGRFQKHSGMTRDVLARIIARKPALSRMPIIANVDFGHTTPLATLPLGGRAQIAATQRDISIIVEDH